MQVFTDEWVRRIRSRYERLPSYQRPYIYSIATSDACQTMRAEIEEWIADLPQVSQKSLIRKLQSPENFMQTYHELAVGNILKRLGYQVEYEKSIADLTPDWYVQPRGEMPAFIVEVFTANISDIMSCKERQVRDLLGRLQRIPIGVVLRIKFYRTEVTLDPRLNKRITKKIQQWLTDNAPPVGAQLCLGGIIFEIIHRDVSYPNVRFIATGEIFRVNPRPLLKNLEAKIRKYKKLFTEAGIPLVIAVVADPRTGLGLDDLVDVLFGQEAVEVFFEKSTGAIIGQGPTRMADGLLRKTIPELSAIVWVWEFLGEWRIKAVHNQKAVNPLPANAFGEE